MTSPISMINDKNTVCCITNGSTFGNLVVGKDGVTKLEIYEEKLGADIQPFCAVFVGDRIRERFPITSETSIFYEPYDTSYIYTAEEARSL